jgi:hypothetical protein
MATHTTPKSEPQHPPLAHDGQGNLIEIPDGTAAWRLCRQTTGRPKELVGPDKRTLRFPLETTTEDLADLCGADVYRVYALDEVGKVLDYVVTVDVARDTRELRNAAPDSQVLSTRAGSAAATSDLRFALEAMAQMMRVNCEALRAVAESQADWVKSIASTRGFFRNGSPPPMPLETPRYDEEDDEDDDEPAQSKTIYDVLAPLAEHWAPSVKPLMSMLASGAGAKAITSGSVAPKVGDDADLSSKPNWEFREFIDLNYAAAKAKAKKEAKHAASTKPSLQARVMADPELMAHFLAIKSLLDPGEAAQILALGERIGEDQQEWLIAKISALSPAEAAALLRTTLSELTDANASTESPK